VCITSKLPSSVIAGSDSLALLEIAVDYPSAFERSSVNLLSVQASVLDTLGRALDPDRLFDRVGYRVPGGPVVYEPSIELRTGQTVFHLGENGSVIDPGNRMTFVLVADVEPDVPFDHFVLEVHQENCLDLVDATDLNHDPGLVESPDCDGLFPFSTGPTEIFLPAGSPVVRIFEMPVQMAYPGQVGVTFFSGEIAYNSSAPQGDLVVKHWRGQILRRTPDGLVAASGSEIFSSIHLLLDGEPVASDTSLTGDTLSIGVGGEYVLARGSVTPVALACDLRPVARPGNYVIRFGDSTFVGFADRDLGTAIHGDIPGRDYPVFSAELTLGAGELANSFVNWPNPFNPAKEATNIGFILAEDAHVDIEVFTITGELVATITSGSLRSEGPHDDEDTWGGLNDAGQTVQPGTYLCRITARYLSGHREEVTRKLAVIR
jgi:hypothetical protein